MCLPSDCQLFSVLISPTSVNGMPFDMNCPFKTANGTNWDFGQLNQWILRNTKSHPFHLHLYHQQIVGGCGDAHVDGEYFDTIAATDGSECLVRFVTRTHAARVMMHCHVLAHEDAGAMGWIHVVPDEKVRYDTEPCCQIGQLCSTPCVALPVDDCARK
jgi:FtsP/CotA-like multicopper oxidase with cupredoxin domain